MRGRELYGVQILRAGAALAVVTHHALETSNGATIHLAPDWVTVTGAAGVDIFFVISGFIMLYTSFPAGQPALGTRAFLARRALRIYPLYWACFLAMLAIHAAGLLQHHHWTVGQIVEQVALLPGPNLVIGVGWTLSFEMFFYLVFALALCTGSRFQTAMATTIAIIAINLAGRIWLHPGTAHALLTSPITLEFCMGLWLCYFAAGRPEAARAVPGWARPVIGLASLLAFFAASLLVPFDNTAGLPMVARWLAWGVPAVILVWVMLGVGRPQSALGRFGVLMGDASYSLYLTHVFVMTGYGWLMRKPAIMHHRQAPIVAGMVLLAVGVSLGCYWSVEQPLRRMLRPRRRTGGKKHDAEKALAARTGRRWGVGQDTDPSTRPSQPKKHAAQRRQGPRAASIPAPGSRTSAPGVAARGAVYVTRRQPRPPCAPAPASHRVARPRARGSLCCAARPRQP